jgi:hypothetical protein
MGQVRNKPEALPGNPHIAVSPEVHAYLVKYCKTTGVAMKHAANEALMDWLETIGTARIEALSKSPKLGHFITGQKNNK